MARILLIDDDPLVRNILQQILELDGHTVVDAANGALALLRWAEQPVDLIVTDILMPEKDGLEVIRELRRQCPELKVIAVSGGIERLGSMPLLWQAGSAQWPPWRSRFQLETFRSTIACVLNG